MRVSSGRREGRSHRQHDLPCQDAFAVAREDERGRVAAAVADGLGSRRLSHVGSQAACEAAAAALASAQVWDEPAIATAFQAALEAMRLAAAEADASIEALATTLQVAGLDGGRAVAGIVGDGAVVYADEAAHVLLPPAESEYANEVVPITHSKWREHFRYAEADDAKCVMLFTDGLTRLLLTRASGEWQPFSPFFDAFLPKVTGDGFDDEIVPNFLSGDNVDKSWDDDKCLVVVARDGGTL